ncbi:MAG: 50S ribosomal protein L11 methyltransferase [Actinomycetota bacterium]|nr:50S ribosomal protein L11 methyltransferase [Actinomycetota bacterium]
MRVARADADPVLAELLELSPAGLEECDDGGDSVEYVIYGAPGELPELPDVRAAVGAALVEVSTTEVPDDWPERWKAFHTPIEVGHVRIRPPWEPRAGDGVDVVIDPAQAFGTGAHWTTRLCLELLLDATSSRVRAPAKDGRPKPPLPLADWGAGSGVLAVVAAKLGYAPVAAVDYDPLSVEACRDNARANGVALDVARVDLRSESGPWAPVVCANLLRPLLLEVAARLERPPELLIVSGLLRQEGDEVAAAFARHGLRERDRREGGEWVALALARD